MPNFDGLVLYVDPNQICRGLYERQLSPLLCRDWFEQTGHHLMCLLDDDVCLAMSGCIDADL